jgi:hypothetical protein
MVADAANPGVEALNHKPLNKKEERLLPLLSPLSTFPPFID